MPKEDEKIIKSKARVQKHGEVFTPAWMVEKMLDAEGIKEACEDLDATFLEPAAGEGNFLVAILKRKLSMVKEKYAESLTQYEHYSLYALSTLYAVELLEDNAQLCAMNMYEAYLENYLEVAASFDKKMKNKVQKAAKFIIATTVQQGDFLTRLDKGGDPITFSEWKATRKSKEKIKVIRTEYSLDEIYDEVEKSPGSTYTPVENGITGQLSLFDDLDLDFEDAEEEQPLIYAEAWITDVYKEEMVADAK